MEYLYLLLLLGWIPILAIRSLICGIINVKNAHKCNHELTYEELGIVDSFSPSSHISNVSVSVTCKKCGYHNSYLKYKG